MEDNKTVFRVIIQVVPIMLSIAALILMLLDVVEFYMVKGTIDYSYSGFQVIFGYTSVNEVGGVTTSVKILSFSIGAFIAVTFPIIGSLLNLFKNRIIKLVALLLTLTGVVLMFMTPNLVVFATSSMKLVHGMYAFRIGIGAIIAGIIYCVQSVVIGYIMLSN